MVDFQYKDSYGVKDLEEIVRLLRAPGGCPWDAEQTHQSCLLYTSDAADDSTNV